MTRYFVAGPGTVVIVLVVPLCVPSSPVTVWVVPAMVEVVKLTVAMPEPLVVEVREPKRAAGAGLRPGDGEAARRDGVVVDVGELRGDGDGAAGDRARSELDVTRYFVAGPAVKVTEVEFDSAEALSVPVIVAVPAVVDEVSVAV